MGPWRHWQPTNRPTPIRIPFRKTRISCTPPDWTPCFSPDAPLTWRFLSAQLAHLDISLPLLGTNGWNHPKLLTWGHRTLEGGLFGDALFLQSADPAVQQFVTHYRERFQTDPSIFFRTGLRSHARGH